MGGSNAGYNAIANSQAIDKMAMGGNDMLAKAEPQIAAKDFPKMEYAKLEMKSPASDSQKEAATYERLRKQGMSDQGIVSLDELKQEAVGTWNDLKSAVKSKISPSGTPNSYGRDTSMSEAAIEAGLK